MSSNPSDSAIAAVRFLVGDPDGVHAVLTDADVQFSLDQAGDDNYAAAAICARALAARYARRVDTRFETISNDYSEISKQYHNLARSLDKQSRTYGTRGVPIPAGGGLTNSDVETANNDGDRVKPYFYTNMFNNPPSPVVQNDDYTDE